MATIDLSRSATDFRKHYTSVRAQQGRVFVDDDHNENERIHGEEKRRELVDIIGPSGAPGKGFLISNPRLTNGKLDFDIGAGALYVGGNRLVNDKTITYQLQPDWLELFGSGAAINPPTATRRDLVYVETWLQAVSAVEDGELAEVAVGIDTGTRLKQMQRVHLFTDIGDVDCNQGWAALLTALGKQDRGTLDAESALVSNATLTITYKDNGGGTDLCSPQVAGGYLGAENQAIRVALVDEKHFTWGFDNAAPLYRVKVATDANGKLTIINMVTEPKDQAHWPIAGQIVELLEWSAALPNWEPVAEVGGFLTKVQSSFDPDAGPSGQFTIADALPVTFGTAFKQRSDNKSFGDVFLYMRVWNRGSDTTSDAKILIAAKADLGHTGLQVTFGGTDRPFHDFWIIAARPDTPKKVVPWALESGKPANGYRRYLAPLGVIEWTVAGGAVTGKAIDDCRKPFLPLTEIGCCCTVTVGDGETSTGQFTKIQDAIAALPPEGGEVCVLPGHYVEAVTIVDRSHITIHGCGDRSLVEAPQDAFGNGTNPTFSISGRSRGIRIEHMEIYAFGDKPGIAVPGSGRVVDVMLRDLHLVAGPRSAIEIIDGQDIAIVGCRVEMRNVAGQWAGIFLAAEDALVRGNTVRVQAPQTQFAPGLPSVPAGRGGIQIGGGSERVSIVDNVIDTGMGNGITLGSLTIKDDPNPNIPIVWIVNVDDPCDPCKPGDVIIIDPVPGQPGGYVSAGDLYEILIKCNRIHNMGLNGIGVVGFFDLSGADEFISVHGLFIAGNDIRRCLARPLAPIPPSMIDSVGYGGIALADVDNLVIRDNLIAENGPSHIEPVCGIFVLHGEGIEIFANRILENGRKTGTPNTSAKDGRRGGINIVYALAPTVEIAFAGSDVPDQNGVPALAVHDNIVSQPLGMALSVMALGPVSVVANEFTTRGLIDRATSPSFIAATVAIVNLGLSNESYLDLLFFRLLGAKQSSNQGSSGSGNQVVAPRQGADDFTLAARLANGNVLFDDNQCVLDLIETGFSLAVSSILIISLDDVGFASNQCDCSLFDDFVYVQAALLAMSVRATANRFKEGRYNALLSAFTVGLVMNTTTQNQATHCITAKAGTPALLVAAPNSVLWGPLGGTTEQCAVFGR